MTAALDLRGVSVDVGDATLVHPVDLHVSAGEWLAIIGPNGAGKSTLLRSIVGAMRSTGEVTIAGHALGDMNRTERARSVSWVPQHPVIPAGFLVYDYVLLGRTPHRPLLAAERPNDLAVVDQVLTELDLADLAQREVSSLSGGERQRVVIARALAQQAPLLLLDEPTTALDIGHQHDVLMTLEGIRQRGHTIVSTMHDLALAAQFADRLVMLAEGRIVAHGSAADVITKQNLADYYGAEVDITTHDGRIILIPTPGGRHAN